MNTRSATIPVLFLSILLLAVGCQINKHHSQWEMDHAGPIEILVGQAVNAKTHIDYVDADTCRDLPAGLTVNTDGVLSGTTNEKGSFEPLCVGVSGGKRGNFSFVLIVR